MPRDTGAPAIGLLAEVDDLGGGVVVRVTRTEPMKAASQGRIVKCLISLPRAMMTVWGSLRLPKTAD